MAIIPQYDHRKRRTCMLVVTHACNLNCTYCYERFKDNGVMTFETARDCILREADLVRRSDLYEELEIDFMGGEPLMNFPLIKQVVEWLESSDIGVPYVTFATSNGTLVTDEVKPWIEAHRETFCIGLSYDGDAEMQARNRGTRPLDLEWFSRVWPSQGVRMTISKETLPTLSQGILSIQRRGIVCAAVLAQGVMWDDEDARIYERELRLLADAYLQDSALSPVEPLLTRHLLEIGAKCPQRRFCGSGGGMVTYDIDGQAYPCHMFTPMVLGDAGARAFAGCDCCESDVVEDPDCAGCSYAGWCPTCYGFNFCFRGDVRKRDHGACKMIDVQVRVSCEFQLKYYHRRIGEIGREDMEVVRAAIRVARLIRSGGINCADPGATAPDIS